MNEIKFIKFEGPIVIVVFDFESNGGRAQQGCVGERSVPITQADGN